MAENRQRTVNRDDDGRLLQGRRLIIAANEREIMNTAKIMKRLRPEYQTAIRMLAEEFA
jgi:hypothetical protein